EQETDPSHLPDKRLILSRTVQDADAIYTALNAMGWPEKDSKEPQVALGRFLLNVEGEKQTVPEGFLPQNLQAQLIKDGHQAVWIAMTHQNHQPTCYQGLPSIILIDPFGDLICKQWREGNVLSRPNDAEGNRQPPMELYRTDLQSGRFMQIELFFDE